ncbi:exodeoxyribonuclease III [Canibacter zhoujuaniae]|uniref:exodeoxyribonuclease III n=1 Tax=Canibacter zhoujuaniae TaxID=2708343 RepID=UPI001423B2B3|nr:exodeoxyribonuclease III [Canibacter zhoujuaniae]
MRIATWNVNSIRTRVGRVVDYLVRDDIDVLAMQEIKCRPDQFPVAAFEDAGYQVVAHGLNQWNGVAFASRHKMTDITTAFDGMPGFGKAVKGQETVQGTGPNGLPQEARALGVTVGELRLWSLYVPNGRALDNPHYEYKLEWLQALRQQMHAWLAADPHLPLALMGDWNIAPTAADMGDPAFIPGASTHVSERERAEFAKFTDVLTDVVRPHQPHGYSFWDYQAAKFERNLGMRIDFIFGSDSFTDAVTNGYIAAEEREGAGPSDHVPVVCDLDLDLLEAAWEEEDSPMLWA